MNGTERLQTILDEYEAGLEEARKKQKPAEGLFGIGHRMWDDPCHDTFDKQVEALTKELAETQSPEAEAVAEALLRAEEDRRWPDHAKWMLMAVQRHVLPLIPLLPPEKARSLGAWYGKHYPRFSRLPVQQQVFKALCAR